MKNTLLALIISLLTLFLGGCSWQEYFVVKNNTNKNVIITYQIDTLTGGGFPIFNQKPTLYQQTKKGSIDWNKTLTVNDIDTNQLIISVSIPSKSTLIIGVLNNDTYKAYDQKFINSRYFNFKIMSITQDLNTKEIIRAKFDDFFTKKKGLIVYNIN